MSNQDPHPSITELHTGQPCSLLDIMDPRLVPLGGPRAMTVYRTLPQRQRSLVGAWCFLDHYGPDDVTETGGMVVPRHPHTGLATVSWLFSGEIDHLDSGGHSASVRPGELNLMIAGSGITHQEVSTPDTTVLHGIQLWYALPERTRFGDNAFEHYVPDLVTAPGINARVFIGELLGAVSPVQTQTTELLGAELTLSPRSLVTVPLRPDFEYSVLAENRSVRVNGEVTPHRSLAYIPPGSDTLVLESDDAEVRLILLGGVPLNEQIVMWWNFIGRNHDEIVEFRRRYHAEMGFEPTDQHDLGQEELFGRFPDGQRAPLPAPVMPSSKLLPRR